MTETSSHNDTSENRSIVKAIGVFGSMRFFQMISQIIIAKFVALFIGPSGVGLLGLLKNAINLIVSFTSFGFSIVSVKEIATHLNTNDTLLQKAITISKRTSWYIGVLGFVVSIALSGILSKWVFNDASQFYWFVLLSLNFLILSRNTFYISLMKGLRLTKVIALSGVLSSISIAAVSLPLYYFFREKGIVPAIILGNLAGLLVNSFLVRKIKKENFEGNIKSYFATAKPMLSLGLYLSINVIFGFLCHFLIKLFFNNYVEDSSVLGFYEVGIVIITSYVGTVFSVMTIDFYPRLTSFQHDNLMVKDLVNKQIIIGVLLVTPLIISFYLFDNWLIILLYSKAFETVSLILKFGLFSTIIKAVIWPLSFIILAKGNKSQYLKQELLGDFMNVTFTILFYLKFGLIGIGLSLCFNFLIYGIYVYYFVCKKYQFSFSGQCFKIITACGILGAAVVIFNLLEFPFWINKLIIGVILLFSIAFSFSELNKQIDLIDFLKKKFLK